MPNILVTRTDGAEPYLNPKHIRAVVPHADGTCSIWLDADYKPIIVEESADKVNDLMNHAEWTDHQCLAERIADTVGRIS